MMLTMPKKTKTSLRKEIWQSIVKGISFSVYYKHAN